MTRRRRLDVEHVDGGARDDASPQSIGQSRRIDQRAAAGVDEHGLALHQAERPLADESLRLGRQRQVKGDRVALREQLVQREFIGLALESGRLGEQHTHSDAARDARRSLADPAPADHAENRAAQIANRGSGPAEVRGVLPTAIDGSRGVHEELAAQRKERGDRVLGDRIAAVVRERSSRQSPAGRPPPGRRCPCRPRRSRQVSTDRCPATALRSV